MPTEGNDSWLLHSFYTGTGWDGDCVWLEAAGMMNAIIFLVGRAQSYSTLPGQLVHFYPPPNFFHLRRRSSIILSQGIPQNFAVQRPKRLHLASSLQLGWVRNIGRFCRGHGSEGGLGVICRKKIQTGKKRAVALEPSLPRLSI